MGSMAPGVPPYSAASLASHNSAMMPMPAHAAMPAQQTLPPGSHSLGTAGSLRPGHDVVLVVSRLLDMPIEDTLLGGTKKYIIRVYDEKDKEVGHSKEIAGMSASKAGSRDTETISVPRDRGVIHLRTHSQLLFVEVSHIGGLMGGSTAIGRCQIHRQDPRSSQIWPYALSSHFGDPAQCGIELKLVEESGAASSSSLHPSVAGMPASPPLSMPGGLHIPNTMPPPTGMPPTGHGATQDMNHGVSALLEFDKITDIPHPRNLQLQEVLLAVLSDVTQKELRRIGPFPAQDQGTSKQMGRLARANCMSSRVFVQAPLQFGGEAQEGAMYLRIAASYGNTGAPSAASELIGITDPIKVGWVPAEVQYYQLRSREGQTLGGVYIGHRLLTETEAALQALNGGANVAGEHHLKKTPHIGAPVEPMHRVSGRTGNFPPGSPEEAFEQAMINAEAQNRALIQRCKIADPASHEDNPHVQNINGYREWDSLDSLFSTMGPNPLTLSEEVGPTVTRGYQEFHSVRSDLRGKLPMPLNPADEKLNTELIRMMYRDDPTKVTAALRPVVCKDPDEIARTKDMSWCPDPPVYAPIRNMQEEDKETLRLACYAPETDAKLMFVDANPNYRIDEDIWGVLADYKNAQSLAVPKHPGLKKRVKDECIMA